MGLPNDGFNARVNGSKSAWRCRSCQAPLGAVRDGTLWPSAPVERVSRDGAVVLRCPCGEERVWFRAAVVAVVR